MCGHDSQTLGLLVKISSIQTHLIQIIKSLIRAWSTRSRGLEVRGSPGLYPLKDGWYNGIKSSSPGLTCTHQAPLEDDGTAHITPSFWCCFSELMSLSSPPEYAPHIWGFVGFLPGAWSGSSILSTPEQVAGGFSELLIGVWIPRGRSFLRSSGFAHFSSLLLFSPSLLFFSRASITPSARACTVRKVNARGEEQGARAPQPRPHTVHNIQKKKSVLSTIIKVRPWSQCTKAWCEMKQQPNVVLTSKTVTLLQS